MLRPYLARALAESTTTHGVFLDVLGMGVLITGDSGVGKSELALELVSRGSGLVADDVVELYRIGPETVEGRCPELLARLPGGARPGRAQHPHHLRRGGAAPAQEPQADRAPGAARRAGVAARSSACRSSRDREIMGVEIRKVTIPVAAGRNLAVLTEAAVRNYVLQLRGIDSTREFIARQAQQLQKRDE